MPMYTYRCKKGHVEEYYLKLAEHEPLRCVTCDGRGLERVLDGQTFSPRTATRSKPNLFGHNYSAPLLLFEVEVEVVKK